MDGHEGNSETTLVCRAREGDVKAFSELYAGIYKELYKFARYILQNDQEAEDAVSETVIAAYENIGKLKKEEAFRSWIFKILKNQCRQRFRTARLLEELKEGIPGTDRDYAQDQDVRAAFALLDEEERMIVAFSVFGGYQSQEIGDMLEMNPATVRSRKNRALKKMRWVLA